MKWGDSFEKYGFSRKRRFKTGSELIKDYRKSLEKQLEKDRIKQCNLFGGSDEIKSPKSLRHGT